MKKNILFIILCFILFLPIGAIAEFNDHFFNITNKEVSINDSVNLEININNINYDKFKIILTSSEKLNNISSTDITLSQDNNEIEFEFDKTASNLNKINLYYKIPNTLHINDNVIFKVKVINIDNEEEYLIETQEIKIIEQKQNKENNKEQENKQNDYPQMNMKNNSSVSTSVSGGLSISNNSSVSATYNGSSDNYLKSLSVKNYSFTNTFKKEKNNYFITVDHTVKKVKVKYKTSSSSSKVFVNGNKDLKEGLNKILITVEAEDGSVRYYRIYVTKNK